MPLKLKNRLATTKGVSMVEVIISIFIIGLAAGVATSMIIMGIQANRVSKNRMVATNLAREGIEAMRNIRDSNWLRYSSNKEDCWNFWERPDKYSGSDDFLVKCDLGAGSSRITNDKYKIMYGRHDLKNENTVPYTYKWFLAEPVGAGVSADIENLNYSNSADLIELNDYKLSYIDILPNDDGNDGDNDFKNDPEHFVYTADSDLSDLKPTIPEFYRQVSVQYLDENDGSEITGGSASNIMEVTVKVLWFENGQKKIIRLKSVLTNYLN